MASNKVTLQCAGDMYVSKYNPTTNYGSATTLKVGGEGVNPSGYDAKYCPYFRFDISSIPKRKRILSAELSLYLSNTTSTAWNHVKPSLYYKTENPLSEMTTIYNDVGPYFYLSSNDVMVYLTNKTPQWIKMRATIPVTAGYSRELGSQMWLGLYPEAYDAVAEFHSRENTNKPYLEITYEDVPPDKPTILYPNGNYVANNDEITFQWKYNSSVGGVQKKFELEWSSDGGSTWNNITQTSSNEKYIAAPDTITSGSIMWRVRTYNEYDEASPWSDILTFYAIGAPAVPVINSISNNARPTVEWASSQQQIYQVQILKNDVIVHDSGEIPGLSDKAYKVKDFLEDGQYLVKVRIRNEYNLYSDWAELQFTIATNKPSKPNLNVYGINYGIVLKINPIENIDHILIYRSTANQNDYKCIGKAIGSLFEDYSVANGETYQYFLRVVKSDNSFNDSEVKVVSTKFSGNTIAAVSNLRDLIQLRYSLDSESERPVKFSMLGDLVYFDGRTYGCFEYSEFQEKNKSLSFYLRSKEEVDKLIALIRRKATLLYRDNDGDKIYGTVNNLEVTNRKRGYVVSFTIMKNDYKEEVEV